MICPEELVAIVNALCVAIAKNLTIDELEILSTVLEQASYTFRAIVIQRINIKNKTDKYKDSEEIDRKYR
ncbi:hypothetical protein JYG23_01655 [Sedimentibacter sp. zth1]|uniref:hypothetical protein n=1 Tax=Sedimentibacter sp. zth1 TaxID=2816908 RepID=UPI001A925411|nr:hypothetical protein [Sedimentibacter sp. zth1]QSX06196.1 hypothetical protein JYG23_01655 [Sedimentibacter sp. zth1]